MRSFWRIFSLEWLDLVRSRALALLVIACGAWMFVAPRIFSGDGTIEGAREMAIRYSLGGVAAIVACALSAVAAGSVSRERAAHRLQLTLVRPVRRMAFVLAKIAALSSVAALVLGAAALMEAVRADSSRNCRHVYRPVLPSPAEEAKAYYAEFMADPATPAEAKKAPKADILLLLAQRAAERYEPVQTNGTVVWAFPDEAFSDRPASLRLRFTNDWHLRDDVRAVATLGSRISVVSNMTRMVAEFPLAAAPEGSRTEGTLELKNVGPHSFMLRPRKDVEVLVEADGFLANLVRAGAELWALATALIAFGVFLGCALSRPVALFTVFVTIALSEMSPTVLSSYSGDLAETRSDALALALTRFSATVTRPVSSLTPLESLAAGECVEPREVAGALAVDCVLLPVFFALLSALILPRKPEDD